MGNSEDIFHKLKERAYYRVVEPKDSTKEDLANTAKMFLCLKTNTLFKNPIWDLYTDEEILIEYFSHLFHKDETYRKVFEASLEGNEYYEDLESFANWADQKILENEKELEEKGSELEDSVNFSPGQT